LHRTLGVSLDALHEQAEAIEHVISDDLAKRLERFLGRPEFDPHGHPISGAARRLPRYAALSDAAKGSNIRIVAIPDRDAAVVRKLVSEHVVPGLRARVIDQSRRETTLRSAKGLHSVSGAVAPFIQVRIERRSRR
jgi:DtxR family Mn-dependent transcriptional regulator